MTAISKTIKFKRGSTFAADCTMQASGSLTDLTDVIITSGIEDSCGKLHPATVAIVDPTLLTFKVTIANTSRFSVGSAFWDIKFFRGGVAFYTETVEVNVIKQVTA